MQHVAPVRTDFLQIKMRSKSNSYIRLYSWRFLKNINTKAGVALAISGVYLVTKAQLKILSCPFTWWCLISANCCALITMGVALQQCSLHNEQTCRTPKKEGSADSFVWLGSFKHDWTTECRRFDVDFQTVCYGEAHEEILRFCSEARIFPLPPSSIIRVTERVSVSHRVTQKALNSYFHVQVIFKKKN